MSFGQKRGTSGSLRDPATAPETPDLPPAEPSADLDNEVDITPSHPRSLINNGLWAVIPTLWSIGVTFFLARFLIHRIGNEHYGLFMLIMSVGGMLGVLNLGLGEATLRYIAYYYGRDDLEGINRTFGSTLCVYSIMAALGFAVLFFGAHRIVGFLKVSADDYTLCVKMLRLTAITFAAGFFSGAFGAIPQALRRFDVSTKVSIAQSAFLVAGFVVVVKLMNKGVYHLVLWGAVVSLVMWVTNMIVAKRLMPGLRLRPWPTEKGLREVFSYGVFSCITSVLNMLWQQADRLLLGVFVSTSAVAFLVVPQAMTFRLLSAVSGLGAGLFPRFSSLSDCRKMQRLYLDAVKITLSATIVVFVPLTVLMPDLLYYWVHWGRHSQSAWIGQIIACGCILRGAFIPHSAVFQGVGKPQYNAGLAVVGIATNIATSAVLIPWFGLAGAGYSYVVGIGWGFVAMYLAWHRALQSESTRPLIATTLPFIGIAAGLVLAALGIKYIWPVYGWVSLIGQGVILAAVCAVSLLALDVGLSGHQSPLRAVLIRGTSSWRQPRLEPAT